MTAREKRPANVLTFHPRQAVTVRERPAEWSDIAKVYRLYLTVSLGKQTPRTYLSCANIFARWCSAHGVSIFAATTDDLMRWYADHMERFARTTATNRMLAVRHLMRWLIANGYRDSDPTEGLKAKRPKKNPQAPYTLAETDRMLAAARNGGYERHDRKRDVALLLVLMDSAARREEIAGLDVADIDWKRHQFLIRDVNAKGAKDRRVAFGALAEKALHEYIGDRTEAVFLNQVGTPMSGKLLHQQVKLIARKAGVLGATVHRFRTTGANRLMEGSMPLDELQKIMGHAQIQTTAAYAGYSAASRALATQRRLVQPPSLLARFVQWVRRLLAGGLRVLTHERS